MPSSLSKLLAVLVAVLALGVAGCGVDSESLEDEIESTAAQQLQVQGADAECPEELPDDSFTCAVTAPDGRTSTAQVTETDDGYRFVIPPFS